MWKLPTLHITICKNVHAPIYTVHVALSVQAAAPSHARKEVNYHGQYLLWLSDAENPLCVCVCVCSQFSVGIKHFVSFYLQPSQSITRQRPISQRRIILVTPRRPEGEVGEGMRRTGRRDGYRVPEKYTYCML